LDANRHAAVGKLTKFTPVTVTTTPRSVLNVPIVHVCVGERAWVCVCVLICDECVCM
jgi:hypothetical protein